ncbi:hypothetical protein DVDV_1896 [Desulfovibrio sp. DV]|nr:hypothetical protein DVDV_1896 [Desulfovibrio sp. DV]
MRDFAVLAARRDSVPPGRAGPRPGAAYPLDRPPGVDIM